MSPIRQATEKTGYVKGHSPAPGKNDKKKKVEGATPDLADAAAEAAAEKKRDDEMSEFVKRLAQYHGIPPEQFDTIPIPGGTLRSYLDFFIELKPYAKNSQQPMHVQVSAVSNAAFEIQQGAVMTKKLLVKNDTDRAMAIAIEMAIAALADPTLRGGVELHGTDEEKAILAAAAALVGLQVRNVPQPDPELTAHAQEKLAALRHEIDKMNALEDGDAVPDITPAPEPQDEKLDKEAVNLGKEPAPDDVRDLTPPTEDNQEEKNSGEKDTEKNVAADEGQTHSPQPEAQEISTEDDKRKESAYLPTAQDERESRDKNVKPGDIKTEKNKTPPVAIAPPPKKNGKESEPTVVDKGDNGDIVDIKTHDKTNAESVAPESGDSTPVAKTQPDTIGAPESDSASQKPDATANNVSPLNVKADPRVAAEPVTETMRAQKPATEQNNSTRKTTSEPIPAATSDGQRDQNSLSPTPHISPQTIPDITKQDGRTTKMPLRETIVEGHKPRDAEVPPPIDSRDGADPGTKTSVPREASEEKSEIIHDSTPDDTPDSGTSLTQENDQGNKQATQPEKQQSKNPLLHEFTNGATDGKSVVTHSPPFSPTPIHVEQTVNVTVISGPKEDVKDNTPPLTTQFAEVQPSIPVEKKKPETADGILTAAGVSRRLYEQVKKRVIRDQLATVAHVENIVGIELVDAEGMQGIANSTAIAKVILKVLEMERIVKQSKPGGKRVVLKSADDNGGALRDIPPRERPFLPLQPH